ncbi:MAG: hypothetical protein IT536_17165 [Hyphomicrobiales bacterium]|nr:hypothetical protein [Hyphomicrobiales bacterium]
MQGEVARWPRIGVPETEQQVDIGGPGAYSVHRHQGPMRFIGWNLAEACEIEFARLDLAGDRLQRLDFRQREADPLQPLAARPADRDGLEGIESVHQTPPDRGCARGRKLLGDDDRGEAGKIGGSLPDRHLARERMHGGEPRVGADELRECGVEFGLISNSRRHLNLEASTTDAEPSVSATESDRGGSAEFIAARPELTPLDGAAKLAAK